MPLVFPFADKSCMTVISITAFYSAISKKLWPVTKNQKKKKLTLIHSDGVDLKFN
jgi:hypothetical protein